MTGDSEFDRLVAPLKGELPDPDQHVDLILVDGTVLHFHSIGIEKLGSTLLRKGVVMLDDGQGNSAFLFRHGVSAIISGKDSE